MYSNVGSTPALMQAAQKLCATAPAPPKASAHQRFLALDAYRGFIMLVLISRGFGLGALAQYNPALTGIAAQFDHKDWEWINFWDLIQPAFLFMVGVAMPFAFARRVEQGFGGRRLFWHVAARSIRLILISQILASIAATRLHVQFIDVLVQIGITYFLCYLLMQLKFRWQVATAALVLIGHWVLFVAFPGTEGPFMSKTTNIGAIIDKAIFGHISAGYMTHIAFITSAVITLSGVWTGRLLQSSHSQAKKMKILAVCAVACLVLGFAIHPWNPIIKKICTTSFALYSTGWVLLMFVAFYWLIEVKAYRKWIFPFVVVGANSLFAYSIDGVLRGWLERAVGVFMVDFGRFAPLAQSCTVPLVMWYLCYWLYRHKIFFKL